jgi:hypothetical protein
VLPSSIAQRMPARIGHLDHLTISQMAHVSLGQGVGEVRGRIGQPAAFCFGLRIRCWVTLHLAV